MKIFYPYNEVLPKKTAHDTYVFKSCASLAAQGHEVTLLCGIGSQDKKTLFKHYGIDLDNPLKLMPLLMTRKNNWLNLSWNWPFFSRVQKEIKKQRPDVVIVSVIKQAYFHFKRRIKGVKYVMEVHQLTWYPNQETGSPHPLEKKALSMADLLTVTTNPLKNILKKTPYGLSNSVVKVPLATDSQKIGSIKNRELTLAYVGQLYQEQGVLFLLEALSQVTGIKLHIYGGKEEEIKSLKVKTDELKISKSVDFKGFFPPAQLVKELRGVDGFITTFHLQGRMPFVAHTKIYEYLSWSKPIIAPNIQVIKEELVKGALLYEVDQLPSLITALQKMKDPGLRAALQREVDTIQPPTWEERAHKYSEILQELFSQKKELII
jgi:glycosyltransferase involved in cell wall biosynthesis